MAIKTKVKAYLTMNNYNQQQLADALNISLPALRNKISRGSYSADDLVKFAAYVGGSVVLKSPAGDVEITVGDLETE